MSEPIIVQARAPEDTDDYVKLLLMSAPEFFTALYGNSFDKVHRELFCKPGNTMSHEHVDVVKVGGETAGMILRYDWRACRSERNDTGLVIFRQMGLRAFSSRLKHMKWVDSALIKMDADTLYLSNMGIYPQFRRNGLATLLLRHCEDFARETGNKRIALDVEPAHEPAMQLYRSFSMHVVGEPKRIAIGRQKFEFLRMEKDV